ncbi:MAG: transglutaminase-like domain-containing protein [Luteolibacter sp.]
MIESTHWIPLRWDFDEKAATKAWQITLIVTAIAAILITLDGNRFTALPRLLIWLPPLLLPMQFIQSYGLRDSIPLTALSFFSKQRHEREQRLGLREEPVYFHFGNVLFLTCLISATLGESSRKATFLPGLAVLVGWFLLAQLRKNRAPLIFAFLIAIGLAIAGQEGLGKAYHRFGRGGGQDSSEGRSFNPEFNKTSIGSLGQLKLSQNIVWRVTPVSGSLVPRLLRTASYSTYFGTSWRNNPSEAARLTGTEFKGLSTVEPVTGQSYYLLQDERDPQGRDIDPALLRYRLRGAAIQNTPLPLPGDTSSITDLDVDGIERNPRGTVRVSPRGPVMEATVLWHGPLQPDSAPEENDLKIPENEEETLRAVAEALGLDRIPTIAGKTQAIRQLFLRDFTYTRYLSIPRRRSPSRSISEIGHFLTLSKRGHCEYFATSAALLLRTAGVPTRYSVGYSVMEKVPRKPDYLLRGIHAHAWTRVWDENSGKWIDFDPTPPSWLEIERPAVSSTQPFTDTLQRLREDFYLWRTRPANRLGVAIVMSLLGLAFTAFVFWKLWGSKRLVGKKAVSQFSQPLQRTPLHDLETLARKHLGPRPPGTTFPQWLRALPVQNPALLEQAIQLHQKLRFDPETPSQDSIEKLQDWVKRLTV